MTVPAADPGAKLIPPQRLQVAGKVRDENHLEMKLIELSLQLGHVYIKA